MNLVAGATGWLGSEICRLLAADGKGVRALVRPTSDPQRVSALRELGAETVEGDVRDPASLARACEGVRAVISTVNSVVSRQPGDSIESVDRQGQTDLVDAAAAGGVRHFVLVSLAPMPVSFPLQEAKQAVEEHLSASGLTYTILQPTYFMEVWLGPPLGFDAANARARIYGSGHGRGTFVSSGDVARFAVTALDHPDARDAVIPIGGPEALSQREVVRIFEEVKGRSFTLDEVPLEALEAQVAAATDPLEKTFAALTLVFAHGHVVDMGRTLERFPLELTSVRDYARRVGGG